MRSRLGILNITGEYVVVHDIKNGKCSIELGDGCLVLVGVDEVIVAPIFKGIDSKRTLSESDMKVIKERLDNINGL